MNKVIKRKLKYFRFAFRIVYNYLINSNKRIDFLIVGAQKAGTSTLFNILNHHPQCRGSDKKEVGFFYRNPLYQKGIQWYHAHFPIFKKRRLFFEATPEYLSKPWCTERIFRYNPSLKLIILLREPVSRAYSAYNHWRQNYEKKPQYYLNVYENITDKRSFENMKKLMNAPQFPSFRSIIEEELNRADDDDIHAFPTFVRTGYYEVHINRFLERFNKNKILIIESNELNYNTLSTLRKIEAFLEIDHYSFDENLISRRKNVRTYRSKIDAKDEQFLKNHFRRYNEALYKLIGQTYDWGEKLVK